MFDVSMLRSGAKTTETISLAGIPHDPRMLAAADEIERLRGVLENIAANTCCDGCQEAAKVAREALSDKEGG